MLKLSLRDRSFEPSEVEAGVVEAFEVEEEGLEERALAPLVDVEAIRLERVLALLLVVLVDCPPHPVHSEEKKGDKDATDRTLARAEQQRRER